MTYKPTVLLDVDGVLADFISGALANLKRLFDIDGKHDHVINWHFETCFGLTSAQAKQLHDSWTEPGFCAGLPPYVGAVDGVNALREYANVYPLTAPFNSVPWVSERDAWLGKHFGFSRKAITHTEAKYLVKGDVFVDDKTEHVIAWQAAHPQGVGILWAQPYNVDSVLPKPKAFALGAVNAHEFTGPAWDGLRTNDWSEVLAIVKAMRWIPQKRRA